MTKLEKFSITAGVIVLVALFAHLGFSNKSDTPDQPVIRIGVLAPLTGKFISFGEDTKNGAELAKQDIERELHIKVELIYEDSAAEPKIAVSAAKKLLEVNKVPIIIGGPGSSANLAVAPMTEQKGVIFLTLSSAPKLNAAGPHTFKILPDIDGEARHMAQYLYDKNFRRVAIMYDTSSDTLTIGEELFTQKFQKLGGEIVAVQGYDSKSVSDFRTMITNIKPKNPDALYFLSIDKVAGMSIKQTRELGLQQPIFGWSGTKATEFFNTAGSTAEGVIITDQPFACDGTMAMQDYCAVYKAKHDDREPLLYGAHTYDLLKIIATQYSADPYVLAQRLLQTHHYQGASGDLTFDAEGNVRDKDFVFRVVKDGKFVPLEQ